MYGRNLKAYKRTSLEAELSVATPHRVIQMLFNGLLERLSQAKGAIERKDYEYKADRITKALGIIDGLQGALERKENPELSDKMYALYDYMKLQLTQASSALDAAPIDEVMKLLMPIKQAWDNIPEDVKTKTNAELMSRQ